MNWTAPTVIQSIINLIVLVAIGLAALGKLRDGRFQDQQDLIGLRGEQIQTLEDQIKGLETSLEGLKQKLQMDSNLASASEQSLRAEIAELQRLNFNLQKQLDRHTDSERSAKSDH